MHKNAEAFTNLFIIFDIFSKFTCIALERERESFKFSSLFLIHSHFQDCRYRAWAKDAITITSNKLNFGINLLYCFIAVEGDDINNFNAHFILLCILVEEKLHWFVTIICFASMIFLVFGGFHRQNEIKIINL